MATPGIYAALAPACNNSIRDANVIEREFGNPLSTHHGKGIDHGCGRIGGGRGELIDEQIFEGQILTAIFEQLVFQMLRRMKIFTLWVFSLASTLKSAEIEIRSEIRNRFM